MVEGGGRNVPILLSWKGSGEVNKILPALTCNLRRQLEIPPANQWDHDDSIEYARACACMCVCVCLAVFTLSI